MPGRWRELHVRGQKLLREGQPLEVVLGRLGITLQRWREIGQACSVRVVAMAVREVDSELE